MTDFDSYLKDLETEVEALKTVKRKSSLAMATITKTITATATIAITSGGVAITTQVPFIKFDPKTPENPFIFSWSLKPYNQRNRAIDILPWIDGDEYGIVLLPGTNSDDVAGTISMDVIITSTGDYTPIISQLRCEEE